MSTWQQSAPPTRPQRIRGGDIPSAPPVNWREQRCSRSERGARSGAEAEQPATTVRFAGLNVDPDGVFTFLLFLALLFIVQLQTLGGAMVAALVPVHLFVRRQRLGRVLAPRAFLFALPALALLSIMWSDVPQETLKASLEMALTVLAGFLISSARSQAAVLKGMALAFFFYVAVALFAGGTVGVGVGVGGSAMSGLTDSKNLLADIASTGVLVSTIVAIMALTARQWLWLALGLLCILVELQAVVGARSAGALLGLAMGVSALLALLPLLAAGKVVRAWLTSIVAVCLIAIGLNLRWLTQMTIDFGAQVFDKDPTLTGRTYLWYRAADLIAERPLAGRGYHAFWMQGNTDAEGLWRYFGITGRGGFTFHNTAIEILVVLGWIGLIVFAATVLVGMFALVRRFIDRPSLPLVLWVSLLLYQLARMPIEAIGLAPFYFSTVLMFAALGAAFGRVDLSANGRAPRQASQPPNVVRVWSAADLRAARGEAGYSPRLLRHDADPGS